MSTARQQIKILIDPQVKRKMDAYIKNCKHEISGAGYVKKLDRTTLLVYDIELIKQEVTAATTDFDMNAWFQYLESAIDSNKNVEDLKVWWHSHAAMSVFWSTTDEMNINKLGVNFWVSIVGNHKGDYLARVDLYDPLRGIMDEAPIDIYYSDEQEFHDSIVAEIAEKVTVFKPPAHQLNRGRIYLPAPTRRYLEEEDVLDPSDYDFMEDYS